MATSLLYRSLLSRSSPAKTVTLSNFLYRSFKTSPTTSSTGAVSLNRFLLRPLAASIGNFAASQTSVRTFSSRPKSSSINDSNPNRSNRPPKKEVWLDGCDFEHWLVVMETPQGEPTRDEIIDQYIKTLAKVIGRGFILFSVWLLEEEARMKIYSVSTRCYYAFGALVSKELSCKLKELPGVTRVLPDSYLDIENKNYGGEPFINGQAVPYNPKYHEEWIRNNRLENERIRRYNSHRPRKNVQNATESIPY